MLIPGLALWDGACATAVLTHCGQAWLAAPGAGAAVPGLACWGAASACGPGTAAMAVACGMPSAIVAASAANAKPRGDLVTCMFALSVRKRLSRVRRPVYRQEAGLSRAGRCRA